MTGAYFATTVLSFAGGMLAMGVFASKYFRLKSAFADILDRDEDFDLAETSPGEWILLGASYACNAAGIVVLVCAMTNSY